MMKKARPRVTPPVIFLRFFRWFCHPSLKKHIEGDLMELYNERLKVSGKRRADLKFALDVILLFRPGIIRSAKAPHTLNQYGMFKNYLNVSIRNILKYKVFSFINIFGLAVSMAVCMMVILILSDQHRYDAFHANKDRIYRILCDKENGRLPYATTPFPLARTLKTDYPIVEDATNLLPWVGGDATYRDKVVEMRGYFAEPSFFNIFSFELEQGNKNTALSTPNTIIISRGIAQRLFKDENPIGKTVEYAHRQLSFPIKYDGQGAPPDPWGSFTVTGVIDEDEYKSHLKFDVLMSASSLQALYAGKKISDLSDNWESYYQTYTYVLLNRERTGEDLANALNDLVARKYANLKSEDVKGFWMAPQKLGDVQLNLRSNDTNERMPEQGYYFLAILALVIMVSACLNYTNLSVARALTRAKEIGVRKVTGANKRALVFQFLSESMITSLLALAMAVIILLFLKPAFKNLWVNQFLNFELPESFTVYVIFIGFALLIGFIAGIYPALHLSTYQPVRVLKSLHNIRPGKLALRKVLSVTQFVISLFFITTSILIFNQFKHFIQFDYGFKAANIVNIELQGQDYQKVSHELANVPEVAAVSACDIIPATGERNGTELKKINSTSEFTNISLLEVNENFIANLGVKLIAGSNLPPAGESSRHFILVNKEAVRGLGYAHPAEIVGQVFETKSDNEPVEVMGVVEDFRFRLLITDDRIGPLMLRNQPGHFKYANVKIVSPDMIGTLSKLEDIWKRIDPVHPFRYKFYDDQLSSTHQAIFDIVSVLGFIAFLAITIACLGLLGMATYTAERKAKEVGIRKILGAENFTVTLLLSKEFFTILIISVCIAGPLSFFVNNLWLQKFPNRVDFGFGTVFLGSLILLVLGAITIGSQTFRASRRNPVEALKME